MCIDKNINFLSFYSTTDILYPVKFIINDYPSTCFQNSIIRSNRMICPSYCTCRSMISIFTTTCSTWAIPSYMKCSEIFSFLVLTKIVCSYSFIVLFFFSLFSSKFDMICYVRKHTFCCICKC